MIPFTAALHELAVHMDDPTTAGRRVQWVYVLRAQEQRIPKLLLQSRQSSVSGIRPSPRCLLSPLGVELPNKLRVPLPALRRGDILDPMVLPEPVRIPKRGEPALRTDSSSGEDEDAIARRDLDGSKFTVVGNSSHQDCRR